MCISLKNVSLVRIGKIWPHFIRFLQRECIQMQQLKGNRKASQIKESEAQYIWNGTNSECVTNEFQVKCWTIIYSYNIAKETDVFVGNWFSNAGDELSKRWWCMCVDLIYSLSIYRHRCACVCRFKFNIISGSCGNPLIRLTIWIKIDPRVPHPFHVGAVIASISANLDVFWKWQTESWR